MRKYNTLTDITWYTEKYRIVQKKKINTSIPQERWSVFEVDSTMYHGLYAFAIFFTKRHLEKFLGEELS